MKVNITATIKRASSAVRHTTGPQWETCFLDIEFGPIANRKSARVWGDELARLSEGEDVFIQGTLKGGTIMYSMVMRGNDIIQGKMKSSKWYSSKNHDEYLKYIA